MRKVQRELVVTVGRAASAEAKPVELGQRAEVFAADPRTERERRDLAEAARRDAEVEAGRVASEAKALREALDKHEALIGKIQNYAGV